MMQHLAITCVCLCWHDVPCRWCFKTATWLACTSPNQQVAWLALELPWFYNSISVPNHAALDFFWCCSLLFAWDLTKEAIWYIHNSSTSSFLRLIHEQSYNLVTSPKNVLTGWRGQGPCCPWRQWTFAQSQKLNIPAHTDSYLGLQVRGFDLCAWGEASVWWTERGDIRSCST